MTPPHTHTHQSDSTTLECELERAQKNKSDSSSKDHLTHLRIITYVPLSKLINTHFKQIHNECAHTHTYTHPHSLPSVTFLIDGIVLTTEGGVRGGAGGQGS